LCLFGNKIILLNNLEMVNMLQGVQARPGDVRKTYRYMNIDVGILDLVNTYMKSFTLSS
jgi:hypothetical protein